MRARLVMAAAACVAVAVMFVSLAAATATAAGGSSHITFGTPTVVDPIHTWGEPDVAINPVDGTYYSSGPTGTGTQRSMWEMSRDAGRTFREITPNGMPNALEGTNAPPGGGDTDIAFDHTGRQYFADLYSLSCFRMATTADDGATVRQDVFPGGCAGMPPSDRQWFAVFDPPHGVTASADRGPFPRVYMEYNTVVGGARWVTSIDGLNYTQASGGESCCPDGYPAIDQWTGDVLQVDADASKDLALNIGTPDATGMLHFLTDGGSPVVVVPAAWMKAHGKPDDLFPVSSLDAARNLWVLFVTENPRDPALQQIWATVSNARSGWRTWAPPVQVSDGSLATGDAVNLMPWIKAGSAGWADAVWYGSGPGADGKIVDASTDGGQAWNLFMSQLRWSVDPTGAVDTTRRPSRTLLKVSPHPMHYNDVCELGTNCITVQGNRNLADFFNLQVDSQGAAVIVYDDTSNQLLQPGAPTSQQAVDHAGAPVVTIVHQTGGMGIFGHPVSGPTAAQATGMTGGGGAVYPVIGGSRVPGLDLTGSSLALSPDGQTLQVTMKVADLSDIPGTASAVGAPLLSYVTRWVLPGSGQDAIYYAEMETDATGAAPQFYAGAAQSVDLCSVSACFPHVITYPEAGPGANSVTGTLDCSTKPCSITIKVPVGDIGSPTAVSSLQEVGAYSFAESHPMASTTNAQAQLDNVPLEVGGICCYDFRAAAEAPGSPGGVAGMVRAAAAALGMGGKGGVAVPGDSGDASGGSAAAGGGSGGPARAGGGAGVGSVGARAPRGAAPLHTGGAPTAAVTGGAVLVILLMGLVGWVYAGRGRGQSLLPAGVGRRGTAGTPDPGKDPEHDP